MPPYLAVYLLYAIEISSRPQSDTAEDQRGILFASFCNSHGKREIAATAVYLKIHYSTIWPCSEDIEPTATDYVLRSIRSFVSEPGNLAEVYGETPSVKSIWYISFPILMYIFFHYVHRKS